MSVKICIFFNTFLFHSFLCSTIVDSQSGKERRSERRRRRPRRNRFPGNGTDTGTETDTSVSNYRGVANKLSTASTKPQTLKTETSNNTQSPTADTKANGKSSGNGVPPSSAPKEQRPPRSSNMGNPRSQQPVKNGGRPSGSDTDSKGGKGKPNSTMKKEQMVNGE